MLTLLKKVRAICRSTVSNDSGQGLVEYALIIGVVSIAIATSLTALKTDISGSYNAAGGSVGSGSDTSRGPAPPPPPTKSGGFAAKGG